jgi:hypothetical protein
VAVWMRMEKIWKSAIVIVVVASIYAKLFIMVVDIFTKNFGPVFPRLVRNKEARTDTISIKANSFLFLSASLV